MTNSEDPDLLASSEANWSGSALFAKTPHDMFSKSRAKNPWKIYQGYQNPLNVFYATNFEEVGRAYCFWLVHLFVPPYVTFLRPLKQNSNCQAKKLSRHGRLVKALVYHTVQPKALPDMQFTMLIKKSTRRSTRILTPSLQKSTTLLSSLEKSMLMLRWQTSKEWCRGDVSESKSRRPC